MKRNPLRTWLPYTFAAIVAPLLAAWPQRAHAADVFWDRGSNSNAWATAGNWSATDAAAAATGALPGTGDVAVFNITGLTGNQTIDMGADRTVAGLRFATSGTVLIQGGGTNRTLNLGASGITKSGTGAITLGSTATNQNANIRLTADQTWSNDNTTGIISVANSLSASSAANRILTLGGTNTGANLISGVISNNGTGVFSIVKSGVGSWTLSNANTFTGGVSIGGGTLQLNNATAAGTGAITLAGATTGGRLLLNGGVTIGNTVNVGTTTGAVGQGTLQQTGTGQGRINGAINITGSPGAGGHFIGGGAAGNELVLAGAINSTVATLSQRDGRVVYAGGGTGGSWNTLLVTNTAIVGATNGIPTGVSLLLGGSGNATLDLNGFNQTLAGIQLGNSGTAFTSTVNLGANTLTLNGDITSVSTATQAVTHLFNATTGGVDTGSTTRSINVVNGPNLDDVVMNVAAIEGSGGLTKTGNGNLNLGSTLGTTNVTGPLSITAGTLTVGRDNLASTVNLGAINFAAGTTLNVNVGTGGDLLNATTATAGAVTVNLTQFGGALAVGQYPILAYTGTSPGLANFTASSLPGRITGGLVDTGTAIALNVTGNDKVIWDGTNSTEWATGTTGNWKLLSSNAAADYLQFDDVSFNDGPTASTVNIATAVQPSNVAITNTSATSYTFTGAGGISGTTALTKTGDGTTILRTPTTYTGATTLSAGRLEFDYDGGATLTASSGISLASGTTLALTRDGTATAATSVLSRNLTGDGLVEVNMRTGTTGTAADGLSVTGNNTGFTGDWVLKAPASGTYRIQDAGPARIGSGDITVENGAQFYSVANSTYNNNITISGTGYADSGGRIGALRLESNTNWAGNITVAAGGARIGAHSTTGTISGSISGGDLNVAGSDGNFNNNYTVIFTGTNSYGKTTIGGGSTATGVSSRRLNIGNGGTTGTLGSGVVEITGDAQNGILGFDRSDGYTLGAGQTITSIGSNKERTFVDIDTQGTGFNDNGQTINLGGNLSTTGGQFRVGQSRANASATLTGNLTAGTLLIGSNQPGAVLNLNSGAVVDSGTVRMGTGSAINAPSTLNINSGATFNAFSVGMGEVASGSGVINQAAGSTVNINAQLRVGHFGTNTSIYNMNGGSLTMTGASSTNSPSTAAGGDATNLGDNNLNLTNPATLVGGGIYLGVDGTGIMNHNAGTVTTNWIVLDNRGANGAGVNMPDGIDAYNISGSSVLNLRSAYGIIGRNDGSYAVNLGGGTIKVDNTGTGGPAGNTGANLNVALGAVLDTVASTTTTLDTNGATNAFTLSKDVRGTGTLALTGGGTVNLSTAAVQTVAANLTSSGAGASLVKLGAGTTEITGNASGYTGDITVSAGRLNLPSNLGAGNLTVADGAAIGGEPILVNTLNLGSSTGSTIFFDPNTSGALTTNTLNVAGTNLIDLTAAPTGAGPFTVINYGTKTGTGTFAVANGSGYRTAPTVTDNIGNAVQVSLTPGLDLNWSGASSAVWDVNTTQNWTDLSSNPQKFYNFDKVTFSDGPTATAISFTGLVAPAAVTVNAATTNYTFNSTAGNQIAGSTSLIKSGASTLTLTGANTYSGKTSIQGGVVAINGTGSIGSGAIGNSLEISGGGRLTHTANTALVLGANRHIAVGTGGGSISHNNATAATITIDGNLTGATGVPLSLHTNAAGGGTYVLTGNNSGFLGNLSLDSSAAGLSTVRLLNNSASPGGGSITLNFAAAGANQSATTLDLPNTELAAGVTLNMTSSLSGTNSLRSQVVSNGAAAIHGPITVAGTAIAQLVPASGTLTVNGNVTVGTGGFNGPSSVFFLRGNGNGIMNGTITLPDGSVTKTDGGTWTINSTGNSWANSGISVGTVNLGAANVLPAAVNLTMGQNDTNTATLNLNGFNQTIGSLTSNPAAVGGNSTQKSITSATPATLTINQSITTTYASLVNGGLSLVKTGNGSLTLAAPTSNFTGNVEITGGTLVASGAAPATGATSPLGAVNVVGKTVTVTNAGSVLSFTSNNVFGNGVANANLPTVTVSNGGVLSSTRYNVLGNVELNGGTLTQASSDTGGYQGFALRGNVTVGGSAASSILTTNGKGTHLGANTTFDVSNVTGNAAADLTIDTPLLNQSGDFTGAGGLTKTGDGTLSLASGVTSSYTGATIVSAGVLNVNGDISSSSSLTVGSGASITGNGGTLPANVTFGPGSVLSPGNSVGTLVTTGSVSFDATSVHNFELNGANTATGGVVNDYFSGITNLTLAGTLNVIETSPGSFLSAGLGDTWSLMGFTGTGSGSLTLGSMPALSNPAWSFEVQTTANSVNLQVVPETSSAGLIGLTALLTLRRRRRAA